MLPIRGAGKKHESPPTAPRNPPSDSDLIVAQTVGLAESALTATTSTALEEHVRKRQGGTDHSPQTRSACRGAIFPPPFQRPHAPSRDGGGAWTIIKGVLYFSDLARPAPVPYGSKHIRSHADYPGEAPRGMAYRVIDSTRRKMDGCAGTTATRGRNLGEVLVFAAYLQNARVNVLNVQEVFSGLRGSPSRECSVL